MSANRHRSVRADAPAPSAAGLRPRFRADIQGLRAVAVLAVALDHAGLGWFSGGFAGVDVFFVVSGFLITQLLLAEVARTGSISIIGFYGRRARRILPAATVVLVVTTLMTALFLSFVQAAAVIRDSVWAALFAANIHFGRIGTDYFSADDPPSPLQHYWSLSVEEQFYLVWPLLLVAVLGLLWLARRRRSVGRHRRTRSGVPRAPILAVLGVVGAVSLWWSVALTGRDPTGAYFSTPARVWELAVGAAAAVVFGWVARLPGWLRAAPAWAGLAMIVLAVTRFDSHTAFPGSAACLPVFGTALLVLTGDRLRFGPALLLDRAPMQAVGNWSYSFYLWHWPFLLLPAAYVGHPLSTLDRLLLLGCALAVSAASYHLVENPFRRWRVLRARVRIGFLLYPAAVGVTLVCAVLANLVVQHEVATAATAPPITVTARPAAAPDQPRLSLVEDDTVTMVRASARAARHHQAVPGRLTPGLLDLHSDIAGVGDCNYEYDAVRLCQRGSPTGTQAVVLFGDSHARAWIPAVESVARRTGLAAYYLVKPGCTAAQVTPDLGHGPFAGCLEWRSWAMQQIRAIRPALTIVTDGVPPLLDGPAGERVTTPFARARMASQGLHSTLAALAGLSGRVVVVGDVPGLTRAPAQCLSSRNTTLADCAGHLSGSYLAVRRLTKQAAAAAGAQFVDVTRWFCADRICPAVVGSTVVYRDQEHITVAYARALANPLGLALALLHERGAQ